MTLIPLTTRPEDGGCDGPHPMITRPRGGAWDGPHPVTTRPEEVAGMGLIP